MLRTTLAGLKARFSRLVLSSIAIVLGVAFVSGTMILGDALTQNLNDGFARQARNVDATVEVDYAASGELPRLSEGVVTAIAKVDGVAGVDRRRVVPAGLLGADGHASAADLVPLAADPALRPNDIVTGAFPSAAGQIAVEKATAEANHLAVGQKLSLVDPRQRRVEFTVTGTYTDGAGAGSGENELIVLPSDAAAFDPGGTGPNGTIVIAAKPGVDQQALVTAVKAALPGGGFAVETGDTYRTFLLKRFGGAGPVTTGMLIFAVIALVVAAMVIYNTFTILIAQRTRELALMRCVGADRKQVFRGVVIEAVAMGLIASVLGLLLGIGLSVALQAGIATGPVLVPLSAGTVLTAFAVGVLVTVLAAWLPARKATRVSPIEALRTQQDSPEEVRRTGRKRLVGAIVLAVAGAAVAVLGFGDGDSSIKMMVEAAASLMLLGAVIVVGPLIVGPVIAVLGGLPRRLFGVPAKLAAGNASRNPKRTAATMAALLLGVTVVTMVTVVATSAKAQQDKELSDRFPADFSVSSVVYDQPVPEAVARQIAARPEIGASGGVSNAVFEMKTAAAGKQVEGGQAVSPGMLGSLIKLDTVSGNVGSPGADEVILSTSAAKDLGVGVGGKISATRVDPVTSKRGQARDLTVSGVFRTTSNTSNDLYLGTDTLRAFAPQLTGFDEVQVKLRNGVSVDAGRAAVEQATASMPNAHVTAAIDEKDKLDASVDNVLALVWAMIGLALVIALFGIANTLTLSVLERTRETALLRALGFTKAQLRQMLVIESFLMALMGAVIGVVLGSLFGSLLITALSTDAVEIPLVLPYWQLAVLLVAAGLAAMLAAAMPARRAGRSSIVAGMAEA
jgi:putative ABC transport system permease protein